MNMNLTYSWLIIVLTLSLVSACLLCKSASAQRTPHLFGIQVKPMFNSRFFDTGPVEATEDFLGITINLEPGAVWGVVLRRSFTDLLALETGINYTKRNYSIVMQDSQNGFAGNTDFRLISYEIPVLGLLYVKLSEIVFMNVAGGISFDFFPSNVTSGNETFGHLTRRTSWTQLALNANFGFDWRTPKSGIFYLGASYHRPFKDITNTLFIYDKDDIPYSITAASSGNYVTLDFRYFLPAEKGNRPASQGK